MEEPSRGIYAGYVHTDPLLLPVGETQGTLAPPPVRTSPGSSELTNLESNMNGLLSYYLTDSSLDEYGVLMLAKAYNYSWTNCYQNPAVITKIISTVNGFAQSYNSGAQTMSGWTCMAPVGEVLYRLQPFPSALQSAMSQTISTGIASDPTDTRTVAWSHLLQLSRDYLRENRDWLAVQSMFVDSSTYLSNKGVEVIDPTNAFTEAQALSYLYQDMGVPGYPWLGNDLPGGGSAMPYGPSFMMASVNGEVKDYGEDGMYGDVFNQFLPDLIEISGDATLKSRYLQILKARSLQRYPLPDADGYQAMRMESVTGWRNDDYPQEVAYCDRSGFGFGLMSALAEQEPFSIGLSQQFVNDDNEYFWAINQYDDRTDTTSIEALLDVPAQYSWFAQQAPSSARLPMTDGQPDFAFADTDNEYVVVKHGTDRLYVNLYWRDYYSINSLARIHYITPTIDHIATVGCLTEYTYSGNFYVVPDWTDTPHGNFYPWPNVDEAIAGVREPSSPDAPGANVPGGYGDPFVGRANFRECRYGNYLIAMNTSTTQTFPVTIPVGETSATDLISGAVFNLTQPVTLAPGVTIVLNLPDQIDNSPLASSPPMIFAGNGESDAAVAWDPSGGATSYNVKRSTAGGAFTTVAGSITGTSYIDTGLSPNTAYNYEVTGLNANGENIPATVIPITTPAANSLPAPWADTDIGAVGLAGSASCSGGVFTVTGSGTDIWVAPDEFHFAYQPLVRDGTIVARVVSQQNTNGWAKSGVLMRPSLNPNAPFVDMLVSPNNGANVQWRNPALGNNQLGEIAIAGVTAPYWVKLQRAGSVFTGYASPDGVTWTDVGSTTFVNLPDIMYVGLEVCSHNNTVLNSTTFDNVSITQSQTGTLNAAAAPSISPNGGSYTSVQTVTLADTTPGATIYYTTNGTQPTTSSATYTGPITVSSSQTIEAMAVAPGYVQSATSSAAFTINLVPVVTSFTPTSGKAGSSVVITGVNFTGATYVRFNGASTSFTVNSATQITATVPSKGSSGTISVTTKLGTGTSSGVFTYIIPPTITSFTPTSGIAGSKVTITGTNFTGATYVRFNGANTTFTVVSATKITATVPSLGSTGTISVTTPSGTATSSATFTYLYLPTITSFTPTSGKAGTMVTITGTNFTGATYVRFNGASTSFTVNSSTQITAKVPTKGSTGAISVTTSVGTGTSTGTYTY